MSRILNRSEIARLRPLLRGSEQDVAYAGELASMLTGLSALPQHHLWQTVSPGGGQQRMYWGFRIGLRACLRADGLDGDDFGLFALFAGYIGRFVPVFPVKNWTWTGIDPKRMAEGDQILLDRIACVPAGFARSWLDSYIRHGLAGVVGLSLHRPQAIRLAMHCLAGHAPAPLHSAHYPLPTLRAWFRAHDHLYDPGVVPSFSQVSQWRAS